MNNVKQSEAEYIKNNFEFIVGVFVNKPQTESQNLFNIQSEFTALKDVIMNL